MSEIKKASLANLGKGKVTVSLGVGFHNPGEDENSESLVNAADKALYKAKANGKNRVEMMD